MSEKKERWRRELKKVRECLRESVCERERAIKRAIKRE
mgnify:CR=1 FL=1